MAMSVSHIGLCVSDLERALRFYVDGLGFERLHAVQVGDDFAATLEAGEGEPVSLTSQFISRDGLTIELLGWSSPSVVGTPSATRRQLGMTHLSLNVDDVDEVAERLVACGGTVLESTRTKLDMGGAALDFVFVADPDGTRVELMRLGG
jgi:lactoylglutathione lyase